MPACRRGIAQRYTILRSLGQKYCLYSGNRINGVNNSLRCIAASSNVTVVALPPAGVTVMLKALPAFNDCVAEEKVLETACSPVAEIS